MTLRLKMSELMSNIGVSFSGTGSSAAGCISELLDTLDMIEKTAR